MNKSYISKNKHNVKTLRQV